jgi:hypothetical protein
MEEIDEKEQEVLDLFMKIYIDIFIAHSTKMKMFSMLTVVEQDLAKLYMKNEEKDSSFLLKNFEEKIKEVLKFKTHEEFLIYMEKKIEEEPFIKVSNMLNIFQDDGHNEEIKTPKEEISLKELEAIIEKVRVV